MSTDDPSTAETADADRRRPAPTIELPATEVAGEPRSSAGAAAGPSPAPRTGGIGRLIAAAIGGGVVALLGYLAADTALRSGPDAAAVQARLASTELQLRELATRPAAFQSDPAVVAALSERVAKVESALAGLRASTPADPALAGRITALEGQVKSSGEIVANLSRQADANAAAVADLTQKVTRLTAAPVERSDLDALAKRIAAIESSEKALTAELAKRQAEVTTDRAVRFAVAAAALRDAVDRGVPFAPLLSVAKPYVADAQQLAPLEPFASTGVPTVAALAQQLSELAPTLFQAAGVAPRDNGLFDRLAANAEKLVRFRSVQDVPGSDAGATVARIEIKAAHSDIAGALAELAKLPANVRAPAEDWIKRTEARTAAIQSGNRLAADALAALGK
jgi:hypothetical protein